MKVMCSQTANTQSTAVKYVRNVIQHILVLTHASNVKLVHSKRATIPYECVLITVVPHMEYCWNQRLKYKFCHYENVKHQASDSKYPNPLSLVCNRTPNHR